MLSGYAAEARFGDADRLLQKMKAMPQLDATCDWDQAFGKGQMGSALMGSLQIPSFDRGIFVGTPVDLRLSSQKCQGVPFSPDLCQSELLLQRPQSESTPVRPVRQGVPPRDDGPRPRRALPGGPREARGGPRRAGGDPPPPPLQRADRGVRQGPRGSWKGGPKEWGVVGNSWFGCVLTQFLTCSNPHVDRCSNPLPWDPLTSPYNVLSYSIIA